MKLISNISLSERALAVFKRERAAVSVRAGEVFALAYMFSFVNADGSTVKGFRPGYMAGAWPAAQLSEKWALAKPPDSAEFYFLPRFKWRARDHYVIDLVSPLYALFSIEPK
jgi:hypothetical protein